MQSKDHWETVYSTRPADGVSWFERHAERSMRQVLRSVRPGGHVIMATFGANGPSQCSGLPVMRYAPGELHAEFGEAFTMLSHDEQMHHTPFGTEQQFIYCMCRKMPV